MEPMIGLQRRDPDRLLPADPDTRSIARDLYSRVAGRPIISPHGHVPAELLASDAPFGDPAELFVVRDHYVTRLLHAAGVDLASLAAGGVAPAALGGGGPPPAPGETGRALARNWHLFAGTASGYWLEEELSEGPRIRDALSPRTAHPLHHTHNHPPP